MFLLFHVQPIMGRFVLPWFGGSAAAWSTCLLCSNRLVDFTPVTEGLALGLTPAEIRSSGSLADGTRDATWVILGERESLFCRDAEVMQAAQATAPSPGENAPRVWTDDCSSLWPLL